MSQDMRVPPRTVIVVEDEPLTSSLVVALLAHEGYDVRAAVDAAQAVRLIRTWDPDALVVDLNLGTGPGGGEVLTAAQRLAPGAAIVILTNSPTPAAAGIDPSVIPAQAAYLNKRSVLGSELLLDTLAAVLADKPPRRDDIEAPDRFEGLSRDQMEVLRMIASGLSNAEIGARRGTSAHAVEQVFHRVLTVLGIPRDATINPRVAAARVYFAHASAPTD